MLTEQVTNTIMNLEQSFINKTTGGLLHYHFKGGETHQLCCPYCQSDGINSKGKKINPSGAKGYFYLEKDATNFICHKCGARMQFHNLLKDNFPTKFIDHVREREHMGTTGKGHNCPTLANALESIRYLNFEKPVFNKNETMTALALLQKNHQMLLKKKNMANQPKFKKYHRCVRLNNKQDAKHTSIA